ncbi:MAG: hypothetical protein JEY99_03170 [Spirochaetales bacterium]|nr:hypothetical protein [Spirochaetales bacterium]
MKKIKIILLFITGVYLTSLTGCVSMAAGMITNGSMYYNSAKNAVEETEPQYITVLNKIGKAVGESDLYKKPNGFIVKNYDEAIQAADAAIAAYETNDSLEAMEELYFMYMDMDNFYKGINDGTDPRVFHRFALNFFNKLIVPIPKITQTVEIPMRDYSDKIVQQQLAVIEKTKSQITSRLESGEYDIAEDMRFHLVETFLASSDYYSHVERYDEANKEIQEQTNDEIVEAYLDIVEAQMSTMDYNALDGLTLLLTKAERATMNNERVRDLKKAFGEKINDLVFNQADKIAEADTAEAYMDAFWIANSAYEFTNDKNAVSAQMNEYAGKAAALYYERVNGAVPTQNTEKDQVTSDEFWRIVNLVSARNLDGFDLEDLLRKWMIFNDESKIRVVALLDENLPNDLDNAIQASLHDSFSRNPNHYWFNSEEERAIDSESSYSFRTKRANTKAWEICTTKDITPWYDLQSSYQRAIAALSASSSINEAKELGLDYVIKITSGTPEIINKQNESRVEEETRDVIRNNDGTYNDNKAEIVALKGLLVTAKILKMNQDDSLNDADAEALVWEEWHADPEISYESILNNVVFSRTYESISANVTMNYTIELVNVHSGETLFTSSFSSNKKQSTAESLVSLKCSDAGVESYNQGLVEEAPTADNFSLSSSQITEMFMDHYDSYGLVTALVGDK